MEKEPGRMMSYMMDILSSQVSLEWKRCTNLPVRMRNAQAVLHNDTLYVGGGLTQRKLQKDEAKLYVYSPTTDIWHAAIDTPVYWFALVVYRSQLILVGGREYHDQESDKPGKTTNKLWTLSNLDSPLLWQEISQLSPMQTKRHSASAINYVDCLLVAGGHHGSKTATLQEEDSLRDVEIFDGQQWATTQPLPKPCWHMKSVIFEKNWCLIGGYGQENDIYYASLDSLIAHRYHSTATLLDLEMPLDLWKKLPDAPNALSSPVMLPENRLITIGGESTADVYIYSSKSETSWLPVKSDLTGAVSNACCILLPTGELLLIGGEGQILEYSNNVVKTTPSVSLRAIHELFDQQIKSLGLATTKEDMITQANDEQMELHVIDSTNSDPDSALKREAISKLENKIASLMIEDEVKDEATGEPKPLYHDVSMDEDSTMCKPQPSTESWDLYGVENVLGGETTVAVCSSENKHFHWEKFGLKLHFPEDSLPLGMEQCIIKIRTSLAGQYEFPDNSNPVSAIFWIRCEPRNFKFNRPVTVEIQHCAKLGNVSKLSFAKADCNQPQLPYTFKYEQGGSFNTHGSYSYGVIKMKRFSGIVVVQTGTTDKEYCSKLFYLDEHVQTDIFFVMTWNTKTHVSEIEEEYQKKGARVGPAQVVEFKHESDEISLDIPIKGITPSSVPGCRITPLTRPTITRKDMDRYQPGKVTPCLQLKAEFVIPNSMRWLPPLKHPVKLLGAEYPHDLFIIDLPGRDVRAVKRSGNSTEDLPSSKLSRSESSARVYEFQEDSAIVAGSSRKLSVDSALSLGLSARADIDLTTGLDTKLDLNVPWHYREVIKYLRILNNDQIREVGGELGLSYSSLLRITTPGEVVAAWLNRQDHVIQVSGQPTWHSLIKALRKQGQEGIASDIEKEKSTA